MNEIIKPSKELLNILLSSLLMTQVGFITNL